MLSGGGVGRGAQGRANIVGGCNQFQPVRPSPPAGALECDWYPRVDLARHGSLAGWLAVSAYPASAREEGRGSAASQARQKGVSACEFSDSTQSPGPACSVKGPAARRDPCIVPVSSRASSLEKRSLRGRKKHAGLETRCRQGLSLYLITLSASLQMDCPPALGPVPAFSL